MRKALEPGLLEIKHTNWLYTSYNHPYLAVYRSVLVKDTSEVYEPVVGFLNRYEHKIVSSYINDDEGMIFGTAVMTIYKIGDPVE